MATEMDVLSLNITGSSANAIKAIDNLISRLKDLDNTFKVLSSSSTYSNNLETAVHSITRVHNAIANINAQHISEVAKAMKSLGNAGNTLAGFGNVSQVGKAMDSVSASSRKMAESISKQFNIKDKTAIDNITASIQRMNDNIGKGDAYYDAESKLASLINENARYNTQLTETLEKYKILREYLNDNTLYIPKGASQEQDFLQNRARIGIRNTTSDPSLGISIEQMQRELKSMIPELQNIINPQDIFGSLANYLESIATPAMVGFDEAVKQGSVDGEAIRDAINQVNSSLGVLVPTLEQLESARNSIDPTIWSDFNEGTVAEEQAIRRLRDELNGFTQEVGNLRTALSSTSESEQPFTRIVNGLSQLEGITIGDFSNISVLAEGVNKLGYQSAVTASQTLPQIAEGLRSFDGITLPELGNMTDFSKGLRSMGGVAVQRAATALPFIADGLKQLKNVGDLPKMEGLNEFAKALSIFGRKTSETAVSTIPKLTQAFQQLFNTMSKAPKISQNTIDAANAMANLVSRTGGVTRALNGANPKLSTWNSNAGKAAKSSFSLASAIGKVYATYWMLFRAFGMIGKAINIASDITEVRNVVAQAFGDMAYKANEFAQIAGNSFGMSKLQALDAASRYQAMGKTMQISDIQVAKANDFLKAKLSDTLALKEVQQAYGDLGNTAADMSLNLTKLAGDLASLYNVDIDVAAEKLNSIFTGTTKPLREFGFDLTQATLQEWALTNGINANIKSMTQAEKAVLRYQYVMANASFVMGDFVRTADSWHNSIVRMKLAFSNLGSVIGQGFINLLKPAVQKITAFVNTITKLVEKAINAIGKLLGWQVQIDPVKALEDGNDSGIGDLEDAMEGAGGGASDIADDLDDADKSSGDTADNLDKAQKAAKKMKDYLLGIDELNVFRPDEDTEDALKDKKNKDKKDKANKGKSGSGSGKPSGGGSEGGATGGEVKFSKYASDIGSWFELGSKIGDTLANALEGIDWDKIYKKASHFGTGLASFLNGLITPRLFYDLGMTIANSLNTALHFLDSFGKHFDWKNFGNSIAAGINGFFENFDFKLLASVLNTWALGLLETLISALKKTKWEMVGEKIGEFLVNVKWLKIGKKVAEAIWEAINAAFKTLKGMFKTAPLETAILGVVSAIGLFKSDTVILATKYLAKLADTLSIFLSYAKQEGVISGLSMAFPRLGNGIEVARLGMIAFNDAFENGKGLMTSLSAGFAQVSSNIAPLGKILLTAAGGLVEFLSVSDGMKSLALHSQSVVSSLAEITLGVTAAGAAFTLAFGFPAGLVITGIVGTIAALKGLNDAFEQIKAEELGERVKKALVNPGGVPIEQVIGNTITSLSKMGDEFSVLAQKSDNLNSVNGNIEDIKTEIALLDTQLKTGVITQEEYTQRVSDAYSRLSAAIKTKVGEAELYIVGALGEGGTISEALKSQGADTDKFVNDTILSGDKLLQKVTDLVQKMSDPQISTEDYEKYRLELEKLTTQTDDTDKAAQALQTSIGSATLDWSSYINADDGTLEIDSVKGSLGEIIDKAENVQTTAETSMNGLVIAMKNAGNEMGAAEIQEMIPGALENINGDIKTKCLEASNTIQEDFVNNITDIIQQAGNDWSQMDDGEKAVYNYNESDYVKEAVNSYKTAYIDPLSQTIETEYGRLGIEGAGWASDAADKIADGLVDQQVYEDAFAPGFYNLESSLNTNIDGLVQNSIETAKKGGGQLGDATVEGFNEKLENANTDEPAQGFFDKLWASLKSIFKWGSPAKTMYPVGENIMGGIVEGFKEKYADITTAISVWFTKYVQPWFTVEKWQALGKNVKDGIMTKWNEFKTQWITSITNWWNANVLPWFNLEKWKAEADHIRESIISKFKEMVQQWITDISNWWNQHVVKWLDLNKWKAEADHIREAIISKFTEMVSEWITKIETWWTKNVLPYFELSKWKEIAGNIKKGIIGAIDDTIKEWGGKIDQLVNDFRDKFKTSEFKKIGEEAMKSLWEGLKGIFSQIKQWWDNNVANAFSVKTKVESDNSDTSTANKKKTSKKASGGIFDDSRWRNVHAYASGGMPDEGQLFWARESGAELVGSIGGNTAVMNNDQIVSSVANGVRQAVTEALAPYLSDISANTKVTANKDFTVQIGDRQIAEANNRGQRQIGAAIFT